MAIPEIERILSCDESGRAAIEKARKDAEDLLAGAEQDVKKLQEQAQEELEEFKQKEISSILQDADRKAAQVEEDARKYCQGLKKLFAAQEEVLVSGFLKRFYQEAGLDDVKAR